MRYGKPARSAAFLVLGGLAWPVAKVIGSFPGDAGFLALLVMGAGIVSVAVGAWRFLRAADDAFLYLWESGKRAQDERP